MIISESLRRSLLSFGQYFIEFGSKMYRQIVGIQIGTDCAPLVADLILFCYERDFKSRDHGGKLCFDFGVDILNKMT